MKRKYFAVYTKLQIDPQAIFANLSWARRFCLEQQQLWHNAKFKVCQIKEIEL
jgi:hypothetical protein